MNGRALVVALVVGCGSSSSDAAPVDAATDSAKVDAADTGDLCAAGEGCGPDGVTCTIPARCVACGAGRYLFEGSTCSCYHNVYLCPKTDCTSSTPGTFTDPGCKTPASTPDSGSDSPSDTTGDAISDG